MRNQLLALFSLLLSASVRAETYNGIEFPSGAASFADAALRIDALYSGGPSPNWRAPLRATGTPDDPAGGLSYQSLGNGGLLELLFVDNYLTNDATTGFDLYVGEVTGTPEDFFLAVRPTSATLAMLNPAGDANGDGFFELGKFLPQSHSGSGGFIALIDIDRGFSGFAPNSLQFDAIQFIDDPTRGESTGITVGFDLESVGAITSAPSGVQTVRGDTDLNGVIDLDDLNNVRNHFGRTVSDELPMPGDTFPFDVDVDLDDLNDVRNNFGASSMPVPEPSSLALLALGAGAFAGRHRRTIASSDL